MSTFLVTTCLDNITRQAKFMVKSEMLNPSRVNLKYLHNTNT